MNVTEELKVLRTVVETLTPLEPSARQRVVEYACDLLGIAHARASTPTQEDARTMASASRDLVQQGKRTPPQQYLRDYNYKIMTKRIAVLAVYLEREQGKKKFGLRDITEAFRAAKESKMPAYSQYGRAVIMGYLAKEGDEYYATSKAELLVDGYNKRSNGDNSEGEA
jgi:hypothetical protein